MNFNIITAKASVVVQKVPTDEKDYHKCSLCVIVPIQPQHIQQKRLDAKKAKTSRYSFKNIPLIEFR